MEQRTSTHSPVWSLIRNRNESTLVGVVNHGSINNHKFRGYEWFSDETGDLVGAY